MSNKRPSRAMIAIASFDNDYGPVAQWLERVAHNDLVAVRFCAGLLNSGEARVPAPAHNRLLDGSSPSSATR